MTIPLDDLLPTNDAVYEPPANLADLFTTGSELFEQSDIFKHPAAHTRGDRGRDFRKGYDAGLFDVLLKSGLAFYLYVDSEQVDDLAIRAAQFGRRASYKVSPSNGQRSQITVESHVAMEERLK